MSGIHRGVQARIRERIPTALYVHCNAHVLNLAIVHSSSDVSVRTMMTIVQEITFAFQYSSKMDKFEQELCRNNAVKCKLDGKSKLKRLCEARWFSRANEKQRLSVHFL